MTKTAIRSCLRAAAATLALLLPPAAPGHAQTPGGTPPGYPAADRDPRLTALARTALPIIAALEGYRDANGRFPDQAAAAALAVERVRVQNLGNFVAFGEWLYSPARDGGGYTLSRKLGWDPRLVYARAGETKRWIYDPGDGSAEKEIVLEP